MRYAAFALATVACLLIALFGLDVRTSITEFLPRDDSSRLLELARELSDAPQSRLLVITVGGDAPASERAPAMDALEEKLHQSGLFAWVRATVASADQEEAYNVLYPARVGLAHLPGVDGPIPDAWLRERVQALKARLGSPLGMLERRLAPGDPLGLFVDHLERQQAARGSLRVEGGRLVTADGRFGVLLAATRAPAFDSAAQREVAALLDRELSALAGAGRLDGEWIGVNRFALEGERSVKGDIERISSLSLIGIFLLYWLIFRSLREPMLVLLPITFGCLLALAICQLCFGFVHGLTLAFGSSIIGVAEDYSTHYFSHRIAAGNEEDNESLMARLWPGMWMGALTTMAGIAALAVSGFPGLMQMALFGVVGVLGALLCTRYVLPGLSRERGRKRQGALGALGERLMKALSIRPIMALLFVVPAALTTLWGLPRATFHDGLQSLRTPTVELDAVNARIQERLGRGAGGRMLVALGASDELALQAAESGQAQLEKARAGGVVQGFRAPTALVPSRETQKNLRRRFTDDASFVPRLSAILAEEGFVPEAFEPFFEELRRPDPTFLTPEQLSKSKLADLLTPFRATLPSGIAYLTQVDTEHSGALSERFQGQPQLFYVDQDALFSQAYGAFRARTLWLVLAGLGLVLSTLWLRYRDLSLCLIGMIPAVLGAGAALGAQALWGAPLNLMHVIGMLLVLSMGVDYGIYMLESRGSAEEGVVTLGGVLLAALTTVLSFGLLALSENPALAGIGTTVGLGLVFSVLMSPVVLVWTQSKRPAPDQAMAERAA